MALADCVERTYVRRYVSKQQFFFKILYQTDVNGIADMVKLPYSLIKSVALPTALWPYWW